MNAEEAKKMAAAHKMQQEENIKMRHEKTIKGDVALLYTHFKSKVEEAVNKGDFTTGPMQFDDDRFDNTVITDVTHKLRAEGYNLVLDKHNAYHKVVFTVSWA